MLKVISLYTIITFVVTIVFCFKTIEYTIINIEYNMKMIIVLICLFVLTGVGIVARIIYEKWNNGYAMKGHLSEWYDRTMRLVGVDWTYKILVRAIPEKLSDKDELVIVNVSANRGVYDKYLFEKLTNDKKCVDMRLMDKEVIERHVTSVDNSFGKLEYYEKLDALNVSSNFELYNIPRTDVLLDIKGCLWYISKSNGSSNVLSTLQAYHDVLKPGGILIVDASDINGCKATFNKELGIITNKYWGYAEISTHQKIKKLLVNKSDLLIWIQENFEMQFIEIENNKPRIRMMIFKKRMK